MPCPRLRRTAVTAPPVAVFLAASLWGIPTAAANEATTIGDRWHDGLDTRYQAHRIGTVAANSGYNSVIDLNGRGSTVAFEDGKRSAVFGWFGHSGPGFITTHNGPDHWINGGFGWWNVDDADEDERFITEYQPFIDVDDMRLAIFSGCHTSLGDPERYGYLVEASVSRGVDAVVSFPGLVYSPQTAAGTAMTDTNYSGGYFWNRAAAYLAQGSTINAAMQKAVSDLIAKEGRGWGYQRYRINGSVQYPGTVRLTPSGWGEPLTSDPSWDNGQMTGTTAAYAGVEALTPTAYVPTVGPRGPLTEVSTAEGVQYRQRPDGSLFDLYAASAATGPVIYSMEDAREVAFGFARDHAAGFHAGWRLVDEESLSHVENDALAVFGWRPTEGRHAGPRQVVVEVDRRSGAVTYFVDARTQSNGAAFDLTEEQAVARALQAIPGRPAQASAEPDVWDRPRWTVTIDRGMRGPQGHQTRDVVRVDVDAATGQVVTVSGT